MRQCDNAIMQKCDNAKNLSASGGCRNKHGAWFTPKDFGEFISEAEPVEAGLATKKKSKLVLISVICD